MTDDQPCSVEEHLERVLSGVRPLEPVDVPLLDALGLACAEDVVATMSLPSFDNSAMDGYAVRHADVATASAERPVLLPVLGEIGAGRAGPRTLAAGTATKIMTGAPVPEGADAIVPYEWTDRGTTKVRVDQAPEPGQHVRPAGDDVAVGDLLVLRSDVYDIGADFVLDQVSVDVPFVDLDGKVYKVIGEFDKRFPEGTPSMRKATSLTVDGDFTFGAHVQVVGDVELATDHAERIAADTVLTADSGS